MSEKYWTERYQSSDTPWDIGEISTPLKAYFDQLKDKEIKILIPGAGNGHEAIYLIQHGFKNVTVCDISEIPIKNLKKQVDGQQIHLLHTDFFEMIDQYDLIVEQTFFCALDRHQREAYVKKMHDLLSENGKIVGLLFASEFTHNGPPHGGCREEYDHLFSSYFTKIIFEPSYNSIPSRAGNELFIILQKKALK